MSTTAPSRKRDRLSALFTRSRQTSPVPSASVARAVAATSLPQPLSVGQRLFSSALAALPEDERILIEKRLLHGAENITAALEAAQTAALAKKNECEGKSWQWTFKGRQVLLRDQAEKIVTCLNMLKPVGDAVAGLDPIHIGLPWAGVSALLKVITANQDQMASLVSGLAMALSISNRLKAYLEYREGLHDGLTTSNFDEALVKLYTHVLRFFASAFRTYDENTATRIVKALWQTSAIIDFENKCDALARNAETEASNCDRILSKSDSELAKETRAKLDDILTKLEGLDSVTTAVSSLSIKVDLDRLQRAQGAAFDSHDDELDAHCLAGTRIDILDRIRNWAEDESSKRIFWLCGTAGTGKSTIARTVASTLNSSGLLGASFFFRRGRGDRGNASRFFPTIVQQLADRMPDARPAIAAALDKDSDLPEQNLQQQFDKLLLEPFSSLKATQQQQRNMVVVLDALDECKRDRDAAQKDVGQILRLLSKADVLGSRRLHIFVTSRPELPVELGFQAIGGTLHEDVRLDEIQAFTIDHDIRLYFDHRFKEIREQFEEVRKSLGSEHDPLPPEWPGKVTIQALVERASPLFIYASTACSWIEQGNLVERLETVLTRTGSLSGLEALYLPILRQATWQSSEKDQRQAIEAFKSIVGAIVTLADPLSVASLSILLEVDKSRVLNTLNKLHSLLSITRGEPVRTRHLSFRDFLVDVSCTDPVQYTAEEFHVNEAETHAKLAAQCIRQLSRVGVLEHNILAIEIVCTQRNDVSNDSIAQRISPETAYACSYWVSHTLQSGQELIDHDQVHQFLQLHFLGWLEALSWLGRLSSAVGHISQLRSNVKGDRSPELLAFLDDAQRFVTMHRYVVDRTPLQLYHSALVFSPANSIVRKTFRDQVQEVFSLLPTVPFEWSAVHQMLEGHREGPISVTFSPDGELLASSSTTQVILWEAVTGQQRHKLSMRWGSSAYHTLVVFSSDSRLLASVSGDNLYVWDARTGEQRHRFTEHTNRIVSMTFSPDCKLLVSACRIVRIWNVATGEQIQQLGQHKKDIVGVAMLSDTLLALVCLDAARELWDIVLGERKRRQYGHYPASAAFSSDGKLLASSYNGVMQITDTMTGALLQTFQTDDDTACIAISRYHKLVAAARSRGPVRIWDVATGQQVQVLVRGTWPCSLAFSSNDRLLASASLDGTVHLLDMTVRGDGQGPEMLGRHEMHGRHVMALAFSADGTLVASASQDCTVRVWDAAGGHCRQRFVGHDAMVKSVAFSTDSQCLLSGSNDCTIRLWNVSNGCTEGTFAGHTSDVTLVGFSPDGKLIASGSEDQTLRIWDASGQGETRVLQSNDLRNSATAFSHDNKMLAVAAIPKYDTPFVRILDLVSGEQMRRISNGCMVRIHIIEFSPDDRYLHSNLGKIDLEPGDSLQPQLSITPAEQTTLRLEGEWVLCRGERVLWLPHDYRGKCSVARGDVLVIGQTSGAVSFFKV